MPLRITHYVCIIYYICLTCIYVYCKMYVPLRVTNTSISNQKPLFKYVKNSRDHFGILIIIVLMEDSFFVRLFAFVRLSVLLFGHAVQHARPQFPQQGSSPCLLQWKCRVLTAGSPSKSLENSLYFINLSLLHFFL